MERLTAMAVTSFLPIPSSASLGPRIVPVVVYVHRLGMLRPANHDKGVIEGHAVRQFDTRREIFGWNEVALTENLLDSDSD